MSTASRQYLNLYQGFEPPPLLGRNLLILLAAVLLLAVALAAYTWVLHRQIAALQTELAGLDARSKTAQQTLLVLGTRLKNSGADPLAGMEAARQSREHLLAALKTGQLGSVDGYSAYLHALARQAGQGVWLTGFAVEQGVAGAEISLAGRSLEPQSVPAYLSRLNGEAVFQGRRFAELALRQGGNAATGDTAEKAFSGVEFSLGKPLAAAKETP